MQRKRFVVLFLALIPLLSARVEAAPATSPAASWLPDDTLIAVEVTQPKAILDLALSAKATAAVTGLTAYQKLSGQPGYQIFRFLVNYFQANLGADWKTTLRQLSSGGLTLAVLRDRGALLIFDADSEKMLQQLHKVTVGLVRGDAKNKGKPDPVASTSYQGTTVWTLGEKEAHAIVGHYLLISNRRSTLQAALDVHSGSHSQDLSRLAAYREAMQAASPTAAARAFVNLALLKQSPGVEKLLTKENQPLLALLTGGLTEPLRSSQWLALSLNVHDDTLLVGAVCDGKTTGAAAVAFAWPAAGAGALPNLAVPGSIGAGSLYRDLHGFYAAKDRLFPERTSGLVFFENMLEIAFAGRELPENILAEAQPEIRFVVAQQHYDPAIGTPQVQAPAFALVLRLRHPQDFDSTLEEAWQKMLGLVNFTRGQKALPGMILDRPRHNEVQFSASHFPKPAGEEKQTVPVRYNFSPALAMFGEYAVLSSTEGLARDLIDALKQSSPGTKPLAGTNTLLEIDGPSLARILSANRQTMAAENMVKEGISLEEAQSKLDLFITLVGWAGHGRLSIVSHDDRPEAELEFKLNLP
jgi:hypothetical protein